VLDLSPGLAASTYAFQQVRGLVSAAQRLMRLGQRDAQQVLHRLKPRVRAAAATSERLGLDQAGAFVPSWDIASMLHERAATRLFIS
jgi:urease accessory protein